MDEKRASISLRIEKPIRRPVGLVIVVIIIIIISSFIYTNMTSLVPATAHALQETADEIAEKWQSDASLISIYGSEYSHAVIEDRHPAKYDRTICPKDNNRNDGKSYLWEFTYYSAEAEKFYTFSLNSDGTVVFSPNEDLSLIDNYYTNRTIKSYLDSDSIGDITSEIGGEIIDNYPDVNIFYWLHSNSSKSPIWEVYYSLDSVIIRSLVISADSGKIIKDGGAPSSIGSSEAVSLAQDRLYLKNDSKVIAIKGIETLYIKGADADRNSAPGTSMGVMSAPDWHPADGRCSAWVISFRFKDSSNLSLVWVWADQEVVVVQSPDTKQYSYIFGSSTSELLSYEDIPSREIYDSINLINSSTTSVGERFITYSLEFKISYLKSYGTPCVWVLTWSLSPDTIVSYLVDGMSGKPIGGRGI